MTLMELFQSDTKMRDVLTKIISQRIRMKSRRWLIQDALRENGIDLGYISTGQVYLLHWFLHPNDPRRVLKKNMTKPRAQRPKR